MTRRIVLGVLVLLMLVAGAVLVGGYAYRFGVMQGLAQSERLVAPDGGAGGAPGPYYFYPVRPFFHHYGGWGWGPFGFLQCLISLLFLFLFFGLLRMLFWRGPWGWRRGWNGPGHWQGGPPPHFEEWHRRAHGEAPGNEPPQKPA